MGFIINKNGILPDDAKVETIKTLLVPTCVREVHIFIRMCSYYRRFITNFSENAEPIINLIRKYAKLYWTKQCQEAFQFLKDSLKAVPLLAYPDPNKPYVLYTDASQSCIGACLTQSSDDGSPTSRVKSSSISTLTS